MSYKICKEIKRCLVCGVVSSSGDVKIRNGINACSACGSFYRNNVFNNYSTLECKRGNSRCFDVKIDPQNSIVCSNGRIWRFACSKCRFDKCIKEGMKIGPSKAYKIASTSNGTFPRPCLEKEIMFSDSINKESSLRSCVTLFDSYRKLLDNDLPGHKVICNTPEDLQITVLSNIDCCAMNLIPSLKQLTGFNNLTLRERCIMYGPCLSRLNMLAMASKKQIVPTLLNTHNSKMMSKFFPNFLQQVTLTFRFIYLFLNIFVGSH